MDEDPEVSDSCSSLPHPPLASSLYWIFLKSQARPYRFSLRSSFLRIFAHACPHAVHTPRLILEAMEVISRPNAYQTSLPPSLQAAHAYDRPIDAHDFFQDVDLDDLAADDGLMDMDLPAQQAVCDDLLLAHSFSSWMSGVAGVVIRTEHAHEYLLSLVIPRQFRLCFFIFDPVKLVRSAHGCMVSPLLASCDCANIVTRTNSHTHAQYAGGAPDGRRCRPRPRPYPSLQSPCPQCRRGAYGGPCPPGCPPLWGGPGAGGGARRSAAPG